MTKESVPQSQKVEGNILAVTLKIRASLQMLYAHIIKSRQLLRERCLKIALFFAFHASKQCTFPSVLFAESNPLLANPCLEVTISPHLFHSREGKHNHCCCCC